MLSYILTHSEAVAETCSLASLLLCAHLVAIKRVKQSTLTRTRTNTCSLVSVSVLARRCCEGSLSARALADCSGCGLWIHLCWSWLPGMAACGLVRVCGCCHSSQNCGVYTHAIIQSWLSSQCKCRKLNILSSAWNQGCMNPCQVFL